jgi:hypothetical protein
LENSRAGVQVRNPVFEQTKEENRSRCLGYGSTHRALVFLTTVKSPLAAIAHFMNTLDSPVASPPQPQSFLFGKIYVGICFFGCFIAGCLAVAAGLCVVQTGDWLNNATTQRSTSQLLAMILMIVLWSTTGIAILRRKKRAIILSYIGAVVAVLGILMRGIIPLDIILAIPTFAIIPYLRHRSSLLA